MTKNIRYYVYEKNDISYFKSAHKAYNYYNEVNKKNKYNFNEICILGIELKSNKLNYGIGSIDILYSEVVYLRNTKKALYRHDVLSNLKNYDDIIPLIKNQIKEVQGFLFNRKLNKILY